MSDDHFDALETRDAAQREADLFGALPAYLQASIQHSSGLRDHLSGFDLASINSREQLAGLPVLRKAELMEAQAKSPPFGGFANVSALGGSRVFMSPGPIWEPQGLGADPWGAARSLYAAGFRAGDVVHNALSYHQTPGGFIMDEALRALGCTVFPAGIGNTEMQVEAARALQPVAYVGTPDYLKVILDKAEEMSIDLSCIKRAMVSGGALFPSMRQAYGERGVNVMQAYATADLGMVAYETKADGALEEGMVINEGLIVEIVRPGTGDPVETGEVGEILVTNFSETYPLVRFATGDLSAALSEPSASGRTNMRIKGWMGRADQRTKVKGMFVDPKQIDQIVKGDSSIAAARLVITRKGSSDAMHLQVLPADGAAVDLEAVEKSLRSVTNLGGTVEKVSDLPNDGKVIVDERDYDA